MCEFADTEQFLELIKSVIVSKFLCLDFGLQGCLFRKLLFCNFGVRVHFGLLIITPLETLLNQESSMEGQVNLWHVLSSTAFHFFEVGRRAREVL